MLQDDASVRNVIDSIRKAALPAAFLAGIALRVILLVTSYGSSDSAYNTLWAETTLQHGVSSIYALHSLANHPPFSFALIREYGRIAQATGLSVPDVFRAAQILADLIAALALLVIGRRTGFGNQLAILYLLTPAVIFISAFHCNTDPMMGAFLLVAIALLLRGRLVAAGVALAFASAIKIVPILLVPLFIAVLGRRAIRFLGAYTVTMAGLFLPTLVIAGPVMIRNVFGYGGFTGEWGIPAFFMILARYAGGGAIAADAARIYAHHGKWAALAVMLALTFIAWKRRPLTEVDAAAGVPVLLLILLFLAPGFGVQYLLWPLALLPLVIGRAWYLILSGLISAFLFYTYTLWSGGFPWWFANANDHYPGKPSTIAFALVVWLSLGVAAAVGSVRFGRTTGKPMPDATGSGLFR